MLSLRRGNAALLLLLATASISVLGAALDEAGTTRPALVSRQSRVPDDPFNEAEICGHDVEKENKDDIWWKTGASLFLDTVINSKTGSGGHENWVQKLDRFVWEKKQSDAWDCTSLPGKCGPPADCLEFHRLKERGAEYWIFKSVSGAQKLMSRWYAVFENQTAHLQDDIVGTMQKYGMDLDTVYNNAVACKLAHPDGSPRAIKVENLRTDSTELPECFFSIDVLKGEFIYSYTEYVPADLWGKW